MFKASSILVLGMAAALAAPAAAVVSGGALTGGSAFSNGGVFQVVANPSGLTVGGDNFGNNNVRAFNEVQDFVLAGNLAVNTGGPILAGTTIRSHYVNFDPAQQRGAIGTITFNGPILGIIWERRQLIDSHFLGAAGVNYVNPTLVGFEDNDFATFSGNTVSYDLNASSPGDSFRVITGVPEPESWAMLIAGFGLVGWAARRRRAVAA
jgi:hypothetical protein